MTKSPFERRATRPMVPLCLGALATAIVLFAPDAHAGKGDAALKEGRRLVAAGKIEEGCAKLEESQNAEPKSATLLELASCHEKLGHLVVAAGEYADAASLAHTEKQYRVETQARSKARATDGKISRLTVAVTSPPDALEVKVDGVLVEDSAWGKPQPMDPGDHAIAASAPKKKPFDLKLTLKPSERRTVAIPALADDSGGGGGAAASEHTNDASAAATATPPAAAASPAPTETQPTSHHRKGRIVFEFGALGGFLLAKFDHGDLTGMGGFQYTIKENAQGDELVTDCASSGCTASFDTMAGWFAGGQAFLGYAVGTGAHFGVRAWGAYRFRGGFLALGGPSLSGNVAGRLWLGLTPLFGIVEQDANASSIVGNVPAQYAPYNGGNSTVPVAIPSGVEGHDEVNSGFTFGGAVEVGLALTDSPSGSLMLSAWPTFLKGTNGYAIALPVGIGYRFY